MFALAQPILLLAGAGIIVPVLIHLWNIRKGTPRKVGSIQLMKQNAHTQARSLRLSERWLLLLRCLLIIVLAILLAKPSSTSEATAKGWILLEPGAKDNMDAAFHSTIDSLQTAGFEFHSFDTSFRRLDFDKEKNNIVTDSLSSTLPYWSLLKLLNQQLPAGFPVYLFTGRDLRRFEGERPQLSLNLHWQSFEKGDRPDTLASTRQVSNDSTHILLYADQASELQYLIAAFRAIQEKTRFPVSTQIISAAETMAQETDWLFWLSEKPLPEFIKASQVFTYKKGNEKEGPVWLQSMNKDEEPFLFTRLIADSNESSDLQPVWNDGKGQIILSRSITKPTTYFFYSRLRPDWNNLIWSGAFAERLFALLETEKSFAINDSRIIDASQMLPVEVQKKNSSPTQALMQKSDLQMPFWWLAFILFASERIVSLRKKRKELYER